MQTQSHNMALKRFEPFPDHHRIAAASCQWFARDERVIGLYLSGSFAFGTPDRYSDIDFNIIVPKNQRETIIQEHLTSTIPQIGTVGTFFLGHHINMPNLLHVFFNAGDMLIHVDYVYNTTADLQLIPKDTPIFFDRGGGIRDWYETSPPVSANDQPATVDLQDLENRFWGWCWNTATKVGRGELWAARQIIEFIRERVLLVLAYHRIGLPNEGPRRLENKFPADILALLHQTIPMGTDKAAYKQALLGLIDGYLRLGGDVLAADPTIQLQMVDRDFFIRSIRSVD